MHDVRAYAVGRTTVTASELRQNIYRLLDQVLDSGEPLEISRKGRLLRLVADEPRGDRLAGIHTNPNVIVGDPDDLVSIDWSGEWDADRQVRP
ncbi:type II toxin-antitoxin system Phd/YefM family antitoxin [Microlunatus elymi]|uniref:Antitoxin n=1 Tax=Microlunatus elymi TaxID=2596828 RepID=A0A516Q524_9ACTN|nr:type II toxin-antitoxin system Phd/YefM family antitoxin [Microlunatus elymi]QDP98321.1 type II toxin-antitoxin system Phd/YefM family antitoxin [Microlunatus elymi]